MKLSDTPTPRTDLAIEKDGHDPYIERGSDVTACAIECKKLEMELTQSQRELADTRRVLEQCREALLDAGGLSESHDEEIKEALSAATACLAKEVAL